jgi:hypothetical protein
MRIMGPAFTAMALAIAGITTFSMADTALAQTQKQDQTSTAHSQLQGRFYKRQKTHKQKTQKTPDTENK